MLQICLVYWMSGFWKLQGGWREPDSLLQILHFDNYARAPAYALQTFPGLLTSMGQGILWTELAGPCLLFCPLWTKPIRWLVIVSFFLLHLGIELTLTVGLFSFVCWAGMDTAAARHILECIAGDRLTLAAYLGKRPR